jgi:transposase
MKRLRPIIKNLPGELEHIKSAKIATGAFVSADMFFMDESRFGLHAITRRVLSMPGLRPVVPFQHRFSNFYLFGAYSPISGAHFTLELPYCNTDCFQIWLDEFSATRASDAFSIVVLDNGAFHKAKRLAVPDNVGLLFLPPYSPELNGAERMWAQLKKGCANRIFKTLEALSDHVAACIKALSADIIKSVVGSPTHTLAFNQSFCL